MSFAAKYNGWCPACNTRIRAGDEVDYAGSRVVHETCAGFGAKFDPFDDRPETDREPEPVITGRRNHQRRCGDCNTIHAGECW